MSRRRVLAPRVCALVLASLLAASAALAAESADGALTRAREMLAAGRLYPAEQAARRGSRALPRIERAPVEDRPADRQSRRRRAVRSHRRVRAAGARLVRALGGLRLLPVALLRPDRFRSPVAHAARAGFAPVRRG